MWDEVLEYRVWCHPGGGRPDFFRPFETYESALAFSNETLGAERPLVLVLQREYIDEPSPGEYLHVKQERITEWHTDHLRRPRRNAETIPSFLSPTAPPNRLDILRGLAKAPAKKARAKKVSGS